MVGTSDYIGSSLNAAHLAAHFCCIAIGIEILEGHAHECNLLFWQELQESPSDKYLQGAAGIVVYSANTSRTSSALPPERFERRS